MGRKLTKKQSKHIQKKKEYKKENEYKNFTDNELEDISLDKLIDKIQKSKTITINEYNKLKSFSIQTNGFQSLQNHYIIMDALLNMSETINFPKKHISINILNFQPKLEQLPHNLDDELITLKKDVPRLIYFQYTKNDIFKKTNLKLKIK